MSRRTSPSTRGARRWVVAALVAALVVAACAESELEASGGDDGTTTTSPPTTRDGERTTDGVDGASGVDDPYFPGLGNGGYDVTAYDLDLDWDADAGRLDGIASIRLVAEDDLDTFNLDLDGLEVASVTVDGEPAPFRREGRELIVDPVASLPTGHQAEVVVDYGGRPVPVRVGSDVFAVGWHTDGRDAYVVSEPAGAATWFPANDHPVDKAEYRIEVTVPSDLGVIANGRRTSLVSSDGTDTYVFEAGDPMATYLASVVIGDLEFVEDAAPNGVPLRSAYPRRLAEAAAVDFARTGEMLVAFEERFGPYPFEVYGQVVVDEPLGFALENQTVSLFGSDLVSGRGTVDAVVAHELAHQWFGNAVSPATWRDVWLNEGFATYGEWVWAEAAGGPPVAVSAERVHARADFGVPPGDPGAAELFQPTVYLRGGLVLHALSVEIGDEAFDELLPTWVERFGGGVASTEDLRALAEELSGRDLQAFFDAWVYGASLPPLP